MKSLPLAVMPASDVAAVPAAEFEQGLYWYNFKTNEYEYIIGTPPSDKLDQFVSQDPAAQGLYKTYLAMGKSPMESLGLVLKAILPPEK